MVWLGKHFYKEYIKVIWAMFHSIWNKQRILGIKLYVVQPLFILAVHNSP